MLLHFDILDYYETSFFMVREFGFSLSDIEELIPFEYNIYINNGIKHLNAKIKALSKGK